MTDKERRTAKYLPFDALKGLQQQIREADEHTFLEEMPVLSEEQKIEMDFILLDCFSHNKPVLFLYVQEGKVSSYCGVIKSIDMLNDQVILLPKKKFLLSHILSISEK